MWYLEMKRILHTKFVWVTVVGILIATLGLNFVITRDDMNCLSIDNTLYEESIYEGDVLEENLLTSLIKIRDEKSAKQRYNSQVWIINSLINSYSGVLYCEDDISKYPDEYASNFYRCWRKKFETLIKKLPMSKQKIALDKLTEVRTPFKVFPGYYLYYSAIGNIEILFVLILFLVSCFAAGTYANSFEDESMEIIATTKRHKSGMRYRVLPVICYGILLSIIATVGTVCVVSSITGFRALSSSLKMVALFSFGNYSIGEVIVIMFLYEILGICALTVLLGYTSIKIKSTNISIGIGIFINMCYIICNRFLSTSNHLVKAIINTLPMATANIYTSISGIKFPFGIFKPHLIAIEVLGLFLVAVVLLFRKISIDYYYG